MTLEHWIMGQGINGNQAAVEEGRALQQKYGDIDPWTTETSLREARTRQLLAPIISAYLENQPSAEVTTATWRDMWQILGEDERISVDIPDLGQKDIEKPGNLIFIPENVPLELLARMFPGMHADYSFRRLAVDQNHVGWRRIGNAIDTSNLNSGIDLREVVISSLFSDMTSGRFLHSVLTRANLRESGEAVIIGADFTNSGELELSYPLDPDPSRQPSKFTALLSEAA